MKTDKRGGGPAYVTWKYGQGTELASIAALEVELAVRLPDDFRAVLIEHDGGRPRPQALMLPNRREVVLERLLAVAPEHGDTIPAVAQALKSRGRGDLIPFAIDPFGNVFCFRRQDDKSAGAIVFWNHETDNTQAVCDSFDDLLSMLREPG